MGREKSFDIGMKMVGPAKRKVKQLIVTLNEKWNEGPKEIDEEVLRSGMQEIKKIANWGDLSPVIKGMKKVLDDLSYSKQFSDQLRQHLSKVIEN